MLTDTKLRNLKPREALFRLADTNGLCIEVRPTGSKIWRYRYRFAGKANMLTVGAYRAVSLAEARAERSAVIADEVVLLAQDACSGEDVGRDEFVEQA